MKPIVGGLPDFLEKFARGDSVFGFAGGCFSKELAGLNKLRRTLERTQTETCTLGTYHEVEHCRENFERMLRLLQFGHLDSKSLSLLGFLMLAFGRRLSRKFIWYVNVQLGNEKNGGWGEHDKEIC